MNPRMALNVAFSYDDTADAYAAGVDSRPYNALYERPAMLDLLPPLPGTRVLDAGCGPGWYVELVEDYWKWVGTINATHPIVRPARGP